MVEAARWDQQTRECLTLGSRAALCCLRLNGAKVQGKKRVFISITNKHFVPISLVGTKQISEALTRQRMGNWRTVSGFIPGNHGAGEPPLSCGEGGFQEHKRAGRGPLQQSLLPRAIGLRKNSTLTLGPDATIGSFLGPSCPPNHQTLALINRSEPSFHVWNMLPPKSKEAVQGLCIFLNERFKVHNLSFILKGMSRYAPRPRISLCWTPKPVPDMPGSRLN